VLHGDAASATCSRYECCRVIVCCSHAGSQPGVHFCMCSSVQRRHSPVHLFCDTHSRPVASCGVWRVFILFSLDSEMYENRSMTRISFPPYVPFSLAAVSVALPTT